MPVATSSFAEVSRDFSGTDSRGIALFGSIGGLPAFTSATLDLTFGKEFGGPFDVFAYTRDFSIPLVPTIPADYGFAECGTGCAPLGGGSPVAGFDTPSGSGFLVSIPFTAALLEALGTPFPTLGVRIEVAGGPLGPDALTFLEGAELVLEAGVIPIPAALPLLLTGLAGLGLIGWRRRKRA